MNSENDLSVFETVGTGITMNHIIYLINELGCWVRRGSDYEEGFPCVKGRSLLDQFYKVCQAQSVFSGMPERKSYEHVLSPNTLNRRSGVGSEGLYYIWIAAVIIPSLNNINGIPGLVKSS